jgi:hypothetical protein
MQATHYYCSIDVWGMFDKKSKILIFSLQESKFV